MRGRWLRSAEPTPGAWTWMPTRMTLHDGTVVKTWGVQVVETGQWVGRVYPIGPDSLHEREARANAALFAASRLMADVLLEATSAWSQQFDGTGDETAQSPTRT